MAGMSQPTAYARSTNFAEDESSNVGGRSTVRTSRVDAELDAVALTTNQIRANLALIQRDDAELRDGKVKLHTLGPDVRALLAAGSVNEDDLRGPWLTATVYGLLNVVSSNGNTYICAIPHTSGTFATDLAAGKWLLLAQGATAASAIGFIPTANISAAQVQAAIEEVDTENRALSSGALASALAASAAYDAALRGELASGDEDEGAALVGVFDPIAPAYLKTVSDIINGQPVSLLRNIPPAERAAMIDGTSTYDAGAKWNELIAAIATAKRGTLDVGVASVRTSIPMLLPSDVVVRGRGLTQTFIKPLNGSTFTAAQGVLMTPGFTEDANLWDYYPTYPAGLAMGVQVRDLCVDANRANVSNANGLMIYGGKWTLRDIGVINSNGHGIWTEAGVPGSSTSGDDLHDFLNMHESLADNIYISNPDKHGWLYRGPNDSRIGRVNIKTPGWGAFIQELDSTISVGNLSITSLHAYSALCGHANGYMIELASAHAAFIYCDSSRKGGVLTTGACVINELYGLGNGRNGAVGGGDYWTLKASVATQVGIYRDTGNVNVTSGTLGGSMWLQGDDCQVANARIVEASGTTIPAKGIKVDGARCNIASGVVQAYDMTSGVALELNSSDCNINLLLRASTTGLDYNNSAQGRNILNLNFATCTTDIDAAAAISTSDVIRVTGDTGNATVRSAQSNIGRMRFVELAANPATPASGAEANLYMKGDKLIAQYNDGGTERWKYLDLTGTGTTWTHTTVAP